MKFQKIRVEMKLTQRQNIFNLMSNGLSEDHIYRIFEGEASEIDRSSGLWKNIKFCFNVRKRLIEAIRNAVLDPQSDENKFYQDLEQLDFLASETQRHRIYQDIFNNT